MNKNNELINKKTLVLTTLLTLASMVPGILLWDRLPDTIATHFGLDGTPDGWSSKLTAVILLPLLMAGLQLLCAFGISTDPKKGNIRPKMVDLVLWIIPIAALITESSILAIAMGKNVDMRRMAFLIVGPVFLVMGNYMPKMQQSYTMGIKIPWTLASEDNWNRTHRMAGKLWVAGGLLLTADAFFRRMNDTALIGLILVLALAPEVYSYLLYRKESRDSLDN